MHKEFKDWAAAQGANLNGIRIHRFPHRGYGILAEKRFKVGQSLTLSCIQWSS